MRTQKLRTFPLTSCSKGLLIRHKTINNNVLEKFGVKQGVIHTEWHKDSSLIGWLAKPH